MQIDLSQYQDSKGRVSSGKLKKHNITSKELYLLYNNTEEPFCLCCNKAVKYMGFKRGFNESCSVKCSNKLKEIKAGKVHNTETFIKKAIEVHGDLYGYSKVNYTNSHEEITVTCPIHGDFEVLPYNHNLGRTCFKCSYKERHNITSWSRDRYKNIETILYYVRLKKENIFKIGITSRSVKERFGKEFNNIEILSEEIFKDGCEAFDKEQNIIRNNKALKYKGIDILESGNSELFISEIII